MMRGGLSGLGSIVDSSVKIGLGSVPVYLHRGSSLLRGTVTQCPTTADAGEADSARLSDPTSALTSVAASSAENDLSSLHASAATPLEHPADRIDTQTVAEPAHEVTVMLSIPVEEGADSSPRISLILRAESSALLPEGPDVSAKPASLLSSTLSNLFSRSPTASQSTTATIPPSSSLPVTPSTVQEHTLGACAGVAAIQPNSSGVRAAAATTTKTDVGTSRAAAADVVLHSGPPGGSCSTEAKPHVVNTGGTALAVGSAQHIAGAVASLGSSLGSGAASWLTMFARQQAQPATSATDEADSKAADSKAAAQASNLKTEVAVKSVDDAVTHQNTTVTPTVADVASLPASCQASTGQAPHRDASSSSRDKRALLAGFEMAGRLHNTIAALLQVHPVCRRLAGPALHCTADETKAEMNRQVPPDIPESLSRFVLFRA
jgi:hypothetical protein